MDEAFVVLVAEVDRSVCEAYPFATEAGAKAAQAWLQANMPGVLTTIIDDHELLVSAPDADND